MSDNIFRFKRFAVAHGGAAMKVGTDGVLLGAWCPMERRPARALDIGTGTGLIALMVAQRGEAWGCAVDGVEIDAGACEQACANFAASRWSERLRAYNTNIQQFSNGSKYDLVVSNPPWFNASLQSPDSRRTVARHTVTLTYDELAHCSESVLTPQGILAAVVPWEHAPLLDAAATACGLHLRERLDVVPLPGRPPRRALMAFSREQSPATCGNLVIESGGQHCYSDDYIALTRDFYLNF